MLRPETKQALYDCGRVGLYHYNEVIYLNKEEVDEICDTHYEIRLQSSQFDQYGFGYLWKKRPEIRSRKVDPNALPYSGRFDFRNRGLLITIQCISHDNVSAIIIGKEEQIIDIINGRMLYTPKIGIPPREANELAFIRDKRNSNPELLDKNGLHITTVDDYEYEYEIYGTPEEIYQWNRKEKKEKSTLEIYHYLQDKWDRWDSSLGGQRSKCQIIMRNYPEIKKTLQEFGWNKSEELKDSGYIEKLNETYNVSWRRLWLCWKLINIKELKAALDAVS